MVAGSIVAIWADFIGYRIGITVIVLGIIFFAFVVYASSNDNQHEQWERTIRCLSCGNKFIPPPR
jgi:hypothetical protein